jgi:hypothetical protein
MRKNFSTFSVYLTVLFFAFFISCSKDMSDLQPDNSNQKLIPVSKATTLTENFDSGTKTSYTDANVTLSTGSWDFNNALLGNSSSDSKNGTQSVRITSTGKIVMLFDKANGAGTVTVNHALYGTDASCTWQLLMSVNQGSTWTQVGSTITTSTTTLTSQSFAVNQSGNVRFEIVKASGTTRMNIDDFSVTDYSSITTLSVSPTALSVAAAANSTASFAVTSNIAWTATSSQTWLTLSAASGSNNAGITVTAAANTATTTRSATVTIAGTGVTSQTVTVTQAGTSTTSTLTVSPNTLSLAAAANSTGSFAVTSNISWTAVSSQTWLTLSAVSGSNNANITATAAANTTTSTRSATVTISGTGVTSQTVTVTQAAGGSTGTVKILFDNTKAETASNADWVIDEDSNNLNWTKTGGATGGSEGNAQRIPTPPQSGITSSTTETYWKGALSAWAVDCAKKGYIVETLPYNGQITYGNSSNAQDLSNYKIYVVDEPNYRFTASEKTAILQFVQNGGSLFMISDHTVSDRDGDGYDSPAVWNDFMGSNTVKTNPFGITFDLANFSGTFANVANLPSDPILHGSYGNVAEVLYSNGTSMTLSTSANSTVKGIVFKSGTSGTTGVLAAYATYGNGKVVAIGDSSIPDDGSGDTGDSLYNGYTQDASGNHRVLLMNAMVWLAN